MIRIKTCGVSDPAFIAKLNFFPVHAIGLMFYQASKRNVTIQQAKELVKRCSPFMQTVGVFVNPTAQFVREVLADVSLNALQFHGDEDESFCCQFDRPYIKAISVTNKTNFKQLEKSFSSAIALLLDNKQGGTGQRFNWSQIPATFSKPLIIAGGINAENITELVANHNVSAIDVSSGIENELGHKSIARLEQLINVLNKAEKLND